MVFVETIATEAGIHTAKKLIDLVIDHAKKYHKFQEESLRDISEILERYLKKCHDSSNSMSTIVFRNQPKTLEELYIPLTIEQELFPPRKNTQSYKLEFGNIEYIEKYPYLKIVDTAGMGKSTIIKFIAMQVIDQEKYIPIIIELRKIMPETNILDFIMEQMSFLDEKFSHQDILDLIKSGDFLFLFDGYDEIPEKYKMKVTEKVQDFLKKVENNHVIISSRKEGGLDCFDGFQTFSIAPLSREEAYDLIRKYDGHGERGEELIAAIENDSNLRLLKEFLTNPLMVSLLYKAYSYKPDIPYKKYLFYDQVYAALFEEHDFTKGGAYKRHKKSGLDMADFKRVLNRLGFYCARNNIVEFTREDLLGVLRDIIEKMPDLSVRSGDFQQDLVTTVPLFIQESGKYRWVHKSFYEYFAACFIRYDAREKQKDIVLKICKRNNVARFGNVLDFYYDMDNRLAQQAILYPFLESFIEHYKTAYHFLDGKFLMNNPSIVAFLKSISYFCEWGLVVSDKGEEDAREAISETNQVLFGRGNMVDGNYVSMTFGFKQGYDIVDLLRMKGVDIFDDMLGANRNSLKTNYKGIPVGIYSVDDDKENLNAINILLTNEKNGFFKQILWYSWMFNYVLDIKKCIELKKTIENNIKIEQIFLDDLEDL